MHAARLAKSGRAEAIGAVWDMLQEELTLLCVTAVEDKLQADVRATLERLRSANVRTWMLTGDKLETAKVIAQNASLVSRHQPFHSLASARTECLSKMCFVAGLAPWLPFCSSALGRMMKRVLKSLQRPQKPAVALND